MNSSKVRRKWADLVRKKKGGGAKDDRSRKGRKQEKGRAGGSVPTNERGGSKRHHKGNTIVSKAKLKDLRRSRKVARQKKMEDVPVEIPSTGMSARSLAADLGVKLTKIVSVLAKEDIKISRTSQLSAEDAEIAVLAFDRIPKISDDAASKLVPRHLTPPSSAEQQARSPIITVMGHVDHGKTTLLDNLRARGVQQTEAGGITQSVSAFESSLGSVRGTFIDTPGHAAFMSMRKSGAAVTDVVLLVVAATEGIKDQTIETLRIANDLDLPVILALNKIDLLEPHERSALRAEAERDIMEHGFSSEDMGGDVQVVEVSAKTGEGLDELEESLSLQTEILELLNDAQAPGEASVLESVHERGVGPAVNAIVRWGTMRVGDVVVADEMYARVRQLRLLGTDGARSVDEAGAGSPVQIVGFSEPLRTGSIVLTAESEEHAVAVCEARRNAKIAKEAIVEEKRAKAKTNDDGADEVSREKVDDGEDYSKLDWAARAAVEAAKKREAARAAAGGDSDAPEEKTQVNLVIKADTQSSLDSIKSSIETIPQTKIDLNIVDLRVGPVSKSDVFKANSFGASIFAFNVKANKSTKKAAEKDKITLKNYDVIYSLLDGVKDHAVSCLDPIVTEKVIGVADVLQIFPIGNGKTIAAGCRVDQGIIKRGSTLRLLRDGEEVWRTTNAMSMKHFSEDVSEAKQGTEFAISLDRKAHYEKGDRIESVEIEMTPQTL